MTHQDHARSGPPRWQRRPDARPDEILRAAMQTFVERGYAATRLEEVAARAGVSKGTIYLYFSNKEELFRSTVKDSILPHLQHGQQRIADYQGPPLLLLRESYLRWSAVVTDPLLGSLSKLVIAESGNFPELARFYMDEVVTPTRALYLDILQRCVAAGDLRPVPLDFVVRELTAPIQFSVMWQRAMSGIDEQPLDMAAYLDFHFDTLLRGLKP